MQPTAARQTATGIAAFVVTSLLVLASATGRPDRTAALRLEKAPAASAITAVDPR